MEFEIVCIVKNRQGIIHNVGTSDGHRYTIDEIISLMKENTGFA